MDTHTIDTAFTGGMQFNSSVSGHDIIMDAAPAEGGNDSGASPKKLMLASLAGCTGMDIVSILNKMKVPFSDFTIRAEAQLTEEHPRIYNKLKLTYNIKVAEHDKVKMEKAVILSQDKYCGVSAMFKAFANLRWTVHYL
ncbi:MAG: OsmC family protein [Ferruginibacter sp.]